MGPGEWLSLALMGLLGRKYFAEFEARGSWNPGSSRRVGMAATRRERKCQGGSWIQESRVQGRGSTLEF
jgi:hypothetical protein